MLDQSLERKFLARIVRDADAAFIAIQRKITEEFFEWTAARKLYGIALWYTQNYSTLLSINELNRLLKQSMTLSPDLQQSIAVLFTQLQIEDLDTDINFLYDQIVSYHKQNMLEGAIRKAAEKFSENKVDQSIAELKYELAKIDIKFRTEVIRSGQLNEFADEIAFEFEDRKLNPKKYEGLMMGFDQMDNITGGLVKSGVALIIAPPKGFKSALAMTICYNAAKRGVYSYYHANEGTYKLFYGRFAAMELSIPYKNIKDDKMTPMEESRWRNWIKSVQEGKHQILKHIYFDEVPPAVSTPELIAERLKKLKEQGKEVGVVVVDHFGRMTTSSKEALQDWQMKGAIAQQICSLALEHRIPFILLSHVKTSSAKEGIDSNKDFDAYDLERSGQPLKDVDYVFSWKIENETDFDRNGKQGYARLALVLSRHSETGTATLNIQGKYMQIQEVKIGSTAAPIQLPTASVTP
ncbi:MAG: DnaB-like helicase C-terminal domain-containing protein [bacterium]